VAGRGWVWLTILSMLAIMFLPRQFQVTVIENKDERHLNKAIWYRSTHWHQHLCCR
jgi:Na+/proline symporter